jgi:hypothetical protein
MQKKKALQTLCLQGFFLTWAETLEPSTFGFGGTNPATFL